VLHNLTPVLAKKSPKEKPHCFCGGDDSTVETVCRLRLGLEKLVVREMRHVELTELTKLVKEEEEYSTFREQQYTFQMFLKDCESWLRVDRWTKEVRGFLFSTDFSAISSFSIYIF
jgi:hypothetical protein